METVKQEVTEERTFTQSELDAIVADRLKRDRAKYADYEQLKGGVDTLFKDDSGTVLKNAKNAYKLVLDFDFVWLEQLATTVNGKNTAPYKYPRIVVFRDELPKTTSGKIQRNKL